MADESREFTASEPKKGTGGAGERKGKSDARKGDSSGSTPPGSAAPGKPTPGKTHAAGERVSGDPPVTEATGAVQEHVTSSVVPPGAPPLRAGSPGVPFAIAAPHHFPAGAPAR